MLLILNRNGMLNSFERFKISLKRKGLKDTFLKALSTGGDHYFDRKYKTDTCSLVDLDDMDIEGNSKEHAGIYQATRVIQLRKLFKILGIPAGKVFVDLGCGKGRVLLIASEFDFKEARGIEFSPILSEIAQNNVALYKTKTKTKTNFNIIHSDVIDCNFSDDEEVLFLFNPFDDFILESVIRKLEDSLKRRNRKVLIIYRHAVFGEIIEKGLNIIQTSKYNVWGDDFVVFEAEDNSEGAISKD